MRSSCDADVDPELVPAQGVVLEGLEVVRLQLPEVPRVLVVVEDVVAVEVVHQPTWAVEAPSSANTSRAPCRAASSACTSAGSL